MDIHSIFMRYSLYRFRYSVEYWFHKKKKQLGWILFAATCGANHCWPQRYHGISQASALDRQSPDFMVKS